MTIKHDEYMIKRLKDADFQKLWLNETIKDYIETGDYNAFFQGLEYVIKSRTSVTQFAENVGIDRVQLVKILHGDTKNPSIKTINKILSGLGYMISITPKTA